METTTDYTATRNACKLCAPLGASLAFKGIERAVPFLHGSQGCSTYIRRYLISHFKEPVDIAASNFSEHTVVFGGRLNLHKGLDNIQKQYTPELIGIASTCLSETIGDDVRMFLHEYRAEHTNDDLPALVQVSTPSYRGTHIDGFYAAVRAVVESVAEQQGATGEHVNLLPGMVSPADLRHLKEIFEDFRTPCVMVPDYSDTLDGPLWQEYQKVPKGGTPVRAIKTMGDARGSIEFGSVLTNTQSAGAWLAENYQVPYHQMQIPLGVRASDAFFEIIEELTGQPTPDKYLNERGRLLDAYADGHKYVAEARAVVYGEEDLVIALSAFLREIGIIPVLCASGGKSGRLRKELEASMPDMEEIGIQVLEDADFMTIEEAAQQVDAGIFIGNSKGFAITKKLNVPLIRVGFPIHDRIGGSRLMHLCYRGTQQLFDRIANALIQQRQESSGIGYFYM
jgi:nitrogenase molybdenum-iron protein NifN